MTAWRIRLKIIRTVLCCVVYDSCTQWYTHIGAIQQEQCWFRFGYIFVHLFRFGILCVFRSTRNNIRGENVHPSVGTSVRPSTKSLSDFDEIWYVHRGLEVDEWCMTVCRMTRFKVKVTEPLKFWKLHFSKSVSSTTYRGSWQMTTNS